MMRFRQDHEEAAFVRDLSVSVRATGEKVLRGIEFEVLPGEILGLAGETGSGKTTLALSMLGHTASGLKIDDGEIVIGDEQLVVCGFLKKPAKELRAMRGSQISYVPQDPANALAPNRTIRQSFASVMSAHGVVDQKEIDAKIKELFADVNLPSDEAFIEQYPHQLSGGQQQRVAIAIAFALDPTLVVMDEPTSGLDVTTTRKVVELVRRMGERFSTGIVFVSHDLGLLTMLADRIVIMRHGEIVEILSREEGFDKASQPYSIALMKAMRHLDVRECSYEGAASHDRDLVRVEDLSARYGETEITHDVSFGIESGKCLAFVGESGSGKTTIARCIAGIHREYSGGILFDGVQVEPVLERRSLESRRKIQYVFQNPTSALNPRRSVGESIEMAVRIHNRCGHREGRERAVALMEDVGLRADHLLALPHQLSGGQRQRVCFARALATNPELLVCDEVTSALDVIVQKEIVELLLMLHRQRSLTTLFITHDFGLAQVLSNQVVVLRQGRIVETGPTSRIISNPQEAYTQELIRSAAYNRG